MRLTLMFALFFLTSANSFADPLDSYYKKSCIDRYVKYEFYKGRPDMMQSCIVQNKYENKFRESFKWNMFAMMQCNKKTGWVVDNDQKGISCLTLDTILMDRFCQWMKVSKRVFKKDGVWINLRFIDTASLYPTHKKLENELARYCHSKHNVKFDREPERVTASVLTDNECIQLCEKIYPDDLVEQCISDCRAE